MRFQAIRGMKDILPGEVERWQEAERIAREFFGRYGFQELRLPIMEKTDLFVRSIGQSTDVVEKEMYTLTDVSGDSLTLRPEATAQVCRAFIEHKIHKSQDTWKVFTIGPMFRHERPQKGRFRQFHQINCEVLGPDAPEVDAEVIAMLSGFLAACGVEEITTKLNSLGCPACRPAYRAELTAFLKAHQSELCPDCRRRLESNPLRALDCKNEGCRQVVAEAPAATDHLCNACRDNFEGVLALLNELNIPYQLDKRLVRGLDYYVRTTFEMISQDLGGQDAVAGGGRYDGLVAALGGPDLPGTGFAIGLERLLLLSDLEAAAFRPDVIAVPLGGEAVGEVLKMTQAMRQAGLKVVLGDAAKSIKSQMRWANKMGARGVLIIGPDEMAAKTASVKNLEVGSQISVTTEPAATSAVQRERFLLKWPTIDPPKD
ncbi:MAG: histidine--tRNA ligase [Deltaproteobacteria bacterium]|nr:histidine--tRNA ligase [Deltaproteobacteria bacterium]